jgi:hypothetical protein
MKRNEPLINLYDVYRAAPFSFRLRIKQFRMEIEQPQFTRPFEIKLVINYSRMRNKPQQSNFKYPLKVKRGLKNKRT